MKENVDEDADIIATALLVNEAHQRVREQWLPDSHTLDEGKYMRGRKNAPTTSLDPKTGNQWLSFAGTPRPDKTTGGLVEAFTGKYDCIPLQKNCLKNEEIWLI